MFRGFIIVTKEREINITWVIFLLFLLGGRVLLCGMSNSRSEIGMSVVHVGFKVSVGVRTNVRVILKITGRP